MLFRAEGFEPLTHGAWEKRRVRDGIRAVVADADAALDRDQLRPADEWDGRRTPLPLKRLPVGAAGVVHALDVLRRRGVGETALDLEAAIERALERYREAPDFGSSSPRRCSRAATPRARGRSGGSATPAGSWARRTGWWGTCRYPVLGSWD